jgi:PAS domain S-box-containing protein
MHNENKTRQELIEKLRLKEEALQAFLDAAMEVLFLMDRDGIILCHNSEFVKRLKISKTDVVGQNAFDFLPADLAVRRRVMLEQVLKTGKPVEFEDDRDGRHIEQRIYPVKGPDGTVVRVAVFGRDITDAKQVEKDLRASEGLLFRTAFHSSPSPMAITDMEDGRLIDVNDQWLKTTGFSRQEVMGKTAVELGVWKEPERRAQLTETLKEKRRFRDLPMTLKSRDGSELELIMSAEIVRIGDREMLLTQAHDITEERKIQNALRENENKFRALAESSPVGIYLTDNIGHCSYVNKRWRRMAGLTTEEAMGEGWVKGIHPEDRELIRNSWYRMVESEGTWGLEYRFQNREGITTWVYGVASPIRNESGVISGYVGNNVDITERKKAEDALRRSEILLDEIGELGKVGGWELDVGTKKVYWTRETYRIHDIPEHENYDLPKATLFYDEPDRSTLIAALQRCTETGEPFDLELRFTSAKGRRLVTHAMGRAVKVDGRVTKVRGYFRDITSRKRAEEDRRELEERLIRSEKMEALGVLAGGVAHELNNHLGILVGYSELLLDHIDASSPWRSDVLRIMEGGEKAAAIVQDLLVMARRGVHVRKAMNLNLSVCEVLASPEYMTLVSYHPHVEVQTDLEEELGNILASPVHIGKTIMNLVSNACEAMPIGGTVTIRTRKQVLESSVSGYDEVRKGEYAVLSVSDTGEGISPEDMKRIFEPFYTRKAMGRHSGTGLGLSVVWGTVNDHDGYIEVASEKGKGTTFTLYFPVTKEAILEKPVSRVSRYRGRRETVLVVDDVGGQRDLAVKILTGLNYSATGVASGEAAVEYLRTNRVDLVVLDMLMEPGMDGLDTYREIVKIHPGQKAIVVSGYAQTERVVEAQTLGAGAYVRKPYLQERLAISVRQELDRIR